MLLTWLVKLSPNARSLPVPIKAYRKGMDVSDFIEQATTPITIEHCTVLQERLARVLQEAYPTEDWSVVLNHINPEWMLEEIPEMFQEEAFAALFKTELGKGVIIGAFVQEHVLNQPTDEDGQA